MSTKLKVTVIASSLAILLFTIVGGFVNVRASSNDGAYRQLSVYSEVLSRIRLEYVEEPNITGVTDGALHGLLESLDANSSYLSAAEYKRYKTMKTGGKADIGAAVSKRFGYAAVVAVIPGGPADKAGVENSDIIESIEGKTTHDMSLAEIHGLLSGDGSTLSSALVRSAEIGALAFVGGRDNGGKVAAQLVDTGKRHMLEQEGLNCWGIWEFSDWAGLAAHLKKGYEYAKQRCTAYPRFVVQRDLVDSFLATYLPVVTSVRFGHPLAVENAGDELPQLDFGPLISAAHRETVASFVEGEPLFRGEAPNGPPLARCAPNVGRMLVTVPVARSIVRSCASCAPASPDPPLESTLMSRPVPSVDHTTPPPASFESESRSRIVPVVGSYRASRVSARLPRPGGLGPQIQ